MLDLEAVDVLVVWDFPVKVGGKTYQTRAPRIGELGKLQRLSSTGASHTVEEMISWVEALFVGEVPNIGDWQTPQLSAFMRGYTTHFFEWSALLQARQRPTANAVN